VDGLVPLDTLRAGETARIGIVVGLPEHVHHLQEFGLRQGTLVEMFRRGNPCIIRMAGSKVCLRADDCLRVMVRPLDIPC
jgi:Fe2+ transport system protein FeoA